MKLFVIVRDIKGQFFGGILTGNMRMYTSSRQVCRELIPESLVFQQYRIIKKQSDVPNIDKFISVKEFREKTNKELPIKFSQIVLDVLGFDRVWIFKDNKLW